MALANLLSSYFWVFGYPETSATGAARLGVVSHVSKGLSGQAPPLPAGPRTWSPPLPAGPRTEFPPLSKVLSFPIGWGCICAPATLWQIRVWTRVRQI